MIDIIFATKNKGKISEINEIMRNTKFNVVAMEDMGINIDVVEDGLTYEENAMKKAVEVMELANKLVLSDDSGIEIDALDKKPGVHSSTFLLENDAYKERNQRILHMMKDIDNEKRTARFVSIIALASPSGDRLITRSTLEGFIANESKGKNGFGYDEIFYVNDYDMTLAQMPFHIKNKISHRAKALEKMKCILLRDYLN